MRLGPKTNKATKSTTVNSPPLMNKNCMGQKYDRAARWAALSKIKPLVSIKPRPLHRPTSWLYRPKSVLQ
jgi:hypothetical protein